MNYDAHFFALDQLLSRTQCYWQLVAFDHSHIPWPELVSPLQALSDDDVAELDSCPHKLQQWLAQYIPDVAQLAPLEILPSLDNQNVAWPFWLESGIKGRKIAQLKSFVSAVDEQHLPVLEWCAGKGHLGRMLSYSGAPRVQSVELQSHLCEQGKHLAQKYQLNIQFDQLDVLSKRASHFVEQQQHGVALHACGALHQQLMQLGVEKQTQKLTLSPCCYHLIEQDYYTAMSERAKQSALQLQKSDLKLALQETVTAADRITQLRQTEVEWRLAFDSMQQIVCDRDTYLSVPSVSKSMFNGTFSDFCFWAADKKGITLPDDIDFDAYLIKGKQRKQVTDRIELIRHAFRRAIELWLVLDRVLFLQQHGYQVTLSEFCAKTITPRNVLIQAIKNKNKE
ncbi:hypothetical protein PULV_a2684 [Pseudoalteromonas ulvae UL12]|uniref:Methyltransferase n=1 Tax=Pseudoalteromonas ulvae TaxID=107327 RepID=A0A244CP92_PSEDV|nr:methyltransferase [Pseudoalteromonas ulvae]MBE0364361.1 hypothetical protein [Pseudoalteromonas ulvae UL12]OUL57326.1 methyltransferase [Pseudoalteromonas ulvae]